jgi:hypothetical protein
MKFYKTALKFEHFNYDSTLRMLPNGPGQIKMESSFNVFLKISKNESQKQNYFFKRLNKLTYSHRSLAFFDQYLKYMQVNLDNKSTFQIPLFLRKIIIKAP